MCNIFFHDIEVGPKNYDINRNRAAQCSTLLLLHAFLPCLPPSSSYTGTAECTKEW